MRFTKNIKAPSHKDILERDTIIEEQHRLLKKALSALTMSHQALINDDVIVTKTAMKMQLGVHNKILKFMNEVKVHENRDRYKIGFQ